MKFSKEFKVGLLAVVSITVLYFGFNFLKGIDIFEKTKNYYALYTNIDGLTISNPVVINGLSIGRVSTIEILQNKDNLVAVELSIDSKIVLKHGTIARLVNTDFLGSKAMNQIFPEPIKNLPEADIPLAGVTAHLSQSDTHQILFMEFLNLPVSVGVSTIMKNTVLMYAVYVTLA